jgi:ribonuclease BN (tRNA processing enzyme)
MIKLHVTGVGDAFTERHHNASLCVEEPRSGVRVQIDCPPAYPRVLADHRRRSGSDLAVDNIDHLILTHLHGDHCGGTEAYLYMRRFLVRKKPVLYGAPEVLAPLWPTRLRGGMEELLLEVPRETDAAAIAERIRDRERIGERAGAQPDTSRERLDESGPRKRLGLLDYTDRIELGAEATRIGPLRFERRFTRHHIPTTALRISVEGRARPVLGYSADTAFDPELIAWLAESELVIHETNYGVHTPLASLLLLPEAIRARMRLIHYPDQLDPDTAPIACLREGTVLEVG